MMVSNDEIVRAVRDQVVDGVRREADKVRAMAAFPAAGLGDRARTLDALADKIERGDV